jgi:spermidine/putrescine transport system permease protein
MRPMKRTFPLPVWLAAFFMLLAVFLTGLWLMTEEAAPASSFPDFSLPLHIGSLSRLLPELERAFYTTLLTLALGYPTGCILALWRRRTAFASCLMPVLFLAGFALLYGKRLIPLLPQWFVSSLLTAARGYAAPFQAIAIILLPLMILCTCSFAKSIDPALARASRCLGASRLRAFLTLTFPRTLKGVPAGFVMTFLPALGLTLASDQGPGAAFDFAVPFGAALLILTAIVITVCLLILKKARSVSPC